MTDDIIPREEFEGRVTDTVWIQENREFIEQGPGRAVEGTTNISGFDFKDADAITESMLDLLYMEAGIKKQDLEERGIKVVSDE